MNNLYRHNYCFLITGDNKKTKVIISNYGYAEAFEQIYYHLTACYCKWEILKSWKMR
jgi:hypothetical protein